MSDGLYPAIEPYDSGLLDVGDGQRLYWEACGAPAGKPALVVHGGPGSGCTPGERRYFDPARYRVVLFDQRGCGRSTPSARDPATSLLANTTAHLVADMERLRSHLGIGRWLLSGGSWGSTLALAYAQRHPERVSEIVLAGVTMTRRSEIDWLYRGLARFFPAEWERFRARAAGGARGRGDAAGEASRQAADGEDASALITAYGRLLADPDPAVRAQAAREWHRWEDATISLERNGSPGAFSDRPLDAMLARARLCAHYFANGGFLDEGALLRDASRLAGIPGVLLHGRLDLEAPLQVAWELAQAWPDAELVVIDDAGHTPTAAMTARKRAALDALAER